MVAELVTLSLSSHCPRWCISHGSSTYTWVAGPPCSWGSVALPTWKLAGGYRPLLLCTDVVSRGIARRKERTRPFSIPLSEGCQPWFHPVVYLPLKEWRMYHPKYARLVYWLFQVENIGEIVSERVSWAVSSCLQQGIKDSSRRVVLHHTRVRKNSYHPQTGNRRLQRTWINILPEATVSSTYFTPAISPSDSPRKFTTLRQIFFLPCHFFLQFIALSLKV